MKLKDLKETPFTTSSASESEIGIRHMDSKKKEYQEIIKNKSGKHIVSIKGFELLKTNSVYILVKDSKLFYGLSYVKKDNGINITWMQNYSQIKNLSSLIFTNILKKDKKIKYIYFGDIHTPENKNLHKNLKKFKQLNVDIWDDRHKIVTSDDPYKGLYANSKFFRFMLEDEMVDYIEDFNIGYLETQPKNDNELFETMTMICDLYYFDRD